MENNLQKNHYAVHLKLTHNTVYYTHFNNLKKNKCHEAQRKLAMQGGCFSPA